MSSDRSPARPFTLLFVCTGNICRSALAERLARAFLVERLGERVAEIDVLSAGTRAVVDSAMHPDSALVLRGYGAEPGDFRARQLEDRMAAEADLVLTMTRGHRSDVLRRAPRALQRTFTVREAAALQSLLAAECELPGEDFPARARGLVKALHDARSRRHGNGDDDIADPIGRPLEAHDEAGGAIVSALLPLLGRLAELVGSEPGRVTRA